MKSIMNALKVIKDTFPSITILNNKDKNGNKCIVLLGIENAFTEMQLKSYPEFQALYTAVDSLADASVTISYTDPSESNKSDGKGLIYIGKPQSQEADLDNLSL